MTKISKELENKLRDIAGLYSTGNDLKARQSLGGYESILKRKKDDFSLNRLLNFKSGLFGKKGLK